MSPIFRLLFLFCVGISSSYASTDSSLVVQRKGDELLLPPFLRDYDGGILNITSERVTDQSHQRSAKPGEWLEYGDSLQIPDRMGVYIQMNEGMQWVGGGVFNGKISNGKWDTKKPAYEIVMNRGWMKVWAKPTPFAGSLQIKTPKATLIVNDGVFWVSANSLKTEVYVLMGSVKEGDQTCVAEKYYEWSGSPAKLANTSEKWDFVSLEHRISQLYPNLVKLSHRANDEWLDDVSAKKYAEIRKRGWVKSDRYYPSPTPAESSKK